MAIGGGQRMRGLLGSDFQDPRTQGIMGLASGLLAGGAPQVGKPVSFGGALSTGINTGLNAFNVAQKRQEELQKRQDELDKQKRLEERQKRLDDANALQNRFQVVGGSLLDLQDPNKPSVVFSPPRKTKSQTLVMDGKYLMTVNEDGTVTYTKSPFFADVEAKEKAAKAAEKNKALPTQLAKAEDDNFEAIDISQGIVSEVDYFLNLIENGQLEFSFGENIADSVSGFFGIANEEARNSAAFKTFLQRLRNDKLRLAKGVQTEGDAQRAMSEILDNLNDKNTVVTQLNKLKREAEKGAETNMRDVNRRRKDQQINPFDFSDYTTPTIASDVGYKVVK